MKSTLKSVRLGSIVGLVICSNALAQGEDFLSQSKEAESRGDNQAAIQLYQSAIIYAPATIEPYLGIAKFYAVNTQLDLAEKYFNIVLELDPANPTAHMKLALLALNQGDVESAEARHEILVEACAPACPEATELRDAISAHGASAMAID
jgi:tetratricopeptide (TPR) repeat protein